MSAPATRQDLTRLLRSWGRGDECAGEALVTLIYDELRRQAAHCLRRERAGHTLQPSALVHETYLRLAQQRTADWKNRAQFFAVAARLMRRVLIDHARRHLAGKRGGSMRCVSLEEATEAEALQTAPDLDLLALEGALVELERLDPGKARTVELRFYAGLDLDEVAKVMGVSASTVTRQWRMARAWLFQRMHRR